VQNIRSLLSRVPRSPSGLRQALGWRLRPIAEAITAAITDQRVAGARWLRRRQDVTVMAWRRCRRPFAEVGGVRIRVGPHISREILRTMDTGEYERPELELIKATLEPDDVVMELGTGVGLLATYCARRLGSDRVHTYEANPDLEPHIRDTFARNGVSPHLEICVLGREAGAVRFWIDEQNFWGSSLVRRAGHGRAVTIPMRPLNGEIRTVRPTFLIIDIEGGEEELCQFADFGPVRKVLIEVHEWALGASGVAAVGEALARQRFRRDERMSTPSVWFLERPDAGDPGRPRSCSSPQP
jgi:FkbM family methyltransferase